MKHLPSNIWNSRAIRLRLFQEAGFDCNWGISEKKHYWVVVPQNDSADGVAILKNYEGSLTNVDPHEMQQEFAKIVLRALQSEYHYDGAWAVGFTHPPTSYGVLTDTANCWNRLIAVWHDEDGDPQYTMESDLPFASQMEAGEAYYVGLAIKSHEQWREVYGKKAMKDDFGITEDQTTKAALEGLK